MIELTALRDWLFKELNANEVNSLPDLLLRKVLKNDKSFFQSYIKLVESNLSIDYMQSVYQYYLADREDLGQDYTPKSLAQLVAKLTEDEERIIDVCSGSGALTIQKWILNKNIQVKCYEIDKTVIPFLLFNLAIRKIDSTVIQGDILNQKFEKKYEIKDGEVRELDSCDF